MEHIRGASPDGNFAKLVDGNVQVSDEILLPGADCAERFHVCCLQESEPATVIPTKDGRELAPCRRPHDKRVARVIFGTLLWWLALLLANPSFAITRGYDDDATPEAAIVVQINNPSGSCTGTLISPTAVLTAKHCVTGDNFSNQNWFGGNGGKPPASPPFTISLGSPIGNGIAAVGAYLSTGQSVYGDNGPVNDQEHGRDVAIIWLEPNNALGYTTPRNPTFGYAHIVRPDLASPVPSDGDDSEGGAYSVPIGISGWSPTSGHDVTKRQVGYYGDIYHYPGYPGGGPGTPSGQYWVHAEAGLQIEPGDSGGPLFWQKPDGTRQLLGVAGGSLQIPFAIDGFDCTFSACDIWTDVTRGGIADWVRNQMEDRSRSLAWLDAHGRSYSWGADGTFHPDYWKGEVDYTGPCNLARDGDCDHWYDEHDNCPFTYNPDQIEGAPCPSASPPPLFLPTPPQNCVPWMMCNDGVEFQCSMVNEVVALKRSDGGIFHDVSIDSDPSRAHIPFIHDYPADGRNAAVYRVCSRNPDGNDACQLGPDFAVTFDHSSCSTGGGGAGGGVTGRQCGQVGQPKCGPIRFQ